MDEAHGEDGGARCRGQEAPQAPFDRSSAFEDALTRIGVRFFFSTPVTSSPTNEMEEAQAERRDGC